MFMELESLLKEREQSSRPYLEFLRTAAMSVGMYVLAPGAPDGQRPHDEDEIYFVLGGKAMMTIETDTRAVGPGSVVFVEAQTPHQFHDIEEELRLLVVFAPAQGSLGGT